MQQNMAANLKNASEFVPQRKVSTTPQQEGGDATAVTGDQKQLTKAPAGYTGANDQLESLEEEGGDD